ncbi:MAG: preQ(1) synthase [Elusimicrobiota bacterium]|nr:preQ(1) synthase [Elusimicrobiota bacterium]
MANKKDKKLSLLGGGKTEYPKDPREASLEVFENPSPERDYTVKFKTKEFTSLCPVTGQPDFAEIIIEYIPRENCIESKSLKLYLFSYRNHGGFAEEIVNRILEDIETACKPKYARVEGKFTARGGITIDVEAEYKEKDK